MGGRTRAGSELADCAGDRSENEGRDESLLHESHGR
jgi:hypothetical protein